MLRNCHSKAGRPCLNIFLLNLYILPQFYFHIFNIFLLLLPFSEFKVKFNNSYLVKVHIFGEFSQFSHNYKKLNHQESFFKAENKNTMICRNTFNILVHGKKKFNGI